MKIEELSAGLLAQVDQACLRYEQAWRSGMPCSVDQVVADFSSQLGDDSRPELVDVLRGELEAIGQELRDEADDSATYRKPFEPTPMPGTTVAGQRGFAGQSGFAAPSVSGSINETVAIDLADGATPRSSGSSSGNAGASTPASHSSGGHSSGVDADSSLRVSLVGKSIGPYAVSKVIAKGGMGVVYQAQDMRLQRPVAIKTMGFEDMVPESKRRRQLVERFEREAKAVAALSHPNIVELFDVGVINDTPYVVMEYLSGRTLNDLIETGPLPIEQTAWIGFQVADALRAAHDFGVIHRDLKPHNVMVSDDPSGSSPVTSRVKLIDFGLSRFDSNTLIGGSDSDTREGVILGTPGYMAPEQARGQGTTSASDMFAFGCLLYELFYGERAIPGETAADRLALTLQRKPQRKRMRCFTSETVCGLIENCLSDDASQRPTALEAAQRLRALQKNAENGETCEKKAFARRHFLTTATGGLLAAFFAAQGISGASKDLPEIRSLAVLPFDDGTSGQNDGSGMPLAGRKMSKGEILSSALESELSRLDSLRVIPFRPMPVQSYVKSAAKDVQVDALLTGRLSSENRGQAKFWVLDWKLLSGKDGSILAGDRFVTPATNDNEENQVLLQSGLAVEVANRIGMALEPSKDSKDPPHKMAYECMMKGRAQADPDSTTGLISARMCFQHAHLTDERVSEPLVGLALASLYLAARTDGQDCNQYRKEASDAIVALDRLGADSPTSDLVRAMAKWQLTENLSDADDLFLSIASQFEFDWRYHHQYGLFCTALGRGSDANRMLSLAAAQSPMSLLIKMDRCRADWIFGDRDQAIQGAMRYRDTTSKDYPIHYITSGLLVDIYEQDGDYDRAANELGFQLVAGTAEEYFKKREATLKEVPYGLFGPEANRAIWQARQESFAPGALISQFRDIRSTSMPLLFSSHPAFEGLRHLDAARSLLINLRYRFKGLVRTPYGRPPMS
ncbi:Serine/threonine-protein kinase PrkC [Stieleria bergensis]|uniref:Serine/threonine-protein kinase PrkC n=1 Tax=Stieleria bergensis TaxID=2528025 RepID=A0A517SUR3_9BACT|nr:Serine/threonine-protein kinase PrkC [Planctomycetes bacterium SV_7m_r]